MAQLAAEHHPRVAGPGVEARVEGELAVFVRPHQLHFAQFLDEAAEQRLVEEFRRGVGVQQRQALRGEVAQGFEFARAERARAVLHQHRDGDVVALERLLQRMADRAQAEHLVGLAGVAGQRAAVFLADLLQQAFAHEHLDGAVDTPGEAVLVPGQEQLRLQERIQRAAEALQLRAAHAPVVLEAHRDPRRGGEQVQHVVAEIAEQHRGVVVDAEHVAERMRRAREHADLLAVGDDLLGRVRGDGDVVRIRHLAQQGLRQRDLRQQVGFAHRVLGRGQQRHRQQVDGIHVGGAVDVDLDALREVLDAVRQPGRFLVLRYRLAVPVRRMFREHFVQRDALAEVHHHLAEVLPQHFRHAPQQRPDRFLFLGLAGKLV